MRSSPEREGEDPAALVEELRQTLERQDHFLAMLVHEMRNPLAPIANALQTLALHPGDPQRVNEARIVIARQLSQLTRLVGDLFDLTRARRGHFSLQWQLLDLADIAMAAVETARPIILERKHSLITRCCTDPVVVRGDASRLTQAFTNLLINAAKYTDEGGRIWCLVEIEPDLAVVRIRDTGIGISQEMQSRIFEIYSQGTRSPASLKDGLGLGLPLARELIELHGGTLSVHSEGLGKGSEFVTHLPRQ